jgi:hypothetical protein
MQSSSSCEEQNGYLKVYVVFPYSYLGLGTKLLKHNSK